MGGFSFKPERGIRPLSTYQIRFRNNEGYLDKSLDVNFLM